MASDQSQQLAQTSCEWTRGTDGPSGSRNSRRPDPPTSAQKLVNLVFTTTDDGRRVGRRVPAGSTDPARPPSHSRPRVGFDKPHRHRRLQRAPSTYLYEAATKRLSTTSQIKDAAKPYKNLQRCEQARARRLDNTSCKNTRDKPFNGG